ncbi:hypothetical protein [Chryseobacterium kwangjuense]|uniref:Lipocalin-like domain-containing protein n=1 Tax=Chryseobacterium kwangjuense TaxID=267125 RepID=A0A135W6E8_9FLAO|nr:hypothetical protein [Chryseobacterium kwangjuense]KXH80510.1 hypothetical protein AU378_19130 [Chryseobacterium kwangjuense]
MKKTAYIFVVLFSMITFFKSQTKVDSSFLFQTWTIKKVDKLTLIYKSQKAFDKKWGGIRFKKNGVLALLHAKPACATAIIEQIEANRLKLYRNRGTWKMDSDTTIIIKSPSFNAINGKFIVSRLPDNSLALKRFIKIAEK